MEPISEKDRNIVTDYTLGYRDDEEKISHDPQDDSNYADDYRDWMLTEGDNE